MCAWCPVYCVFNIKFLYLYVYTILFSVQIHLYNPVLSQTSPLTSAWDVKGFMTTTDNPPLCSSITQAVVFLLYVSAPPCISRRMTAIFCLLCYMSEPIDDMHAVKN